MTTKSKQEIQNQLAPLAKTLFNDNLVCLFRHGDALSQISLFLKDLNPHKLPEISGFLKVLEKMHLSMAYLFTPEMVQTAADTYPLEFLDIAQHHEVLIGEMPLLGFVPSRAALRLQCERELRGLLIHLHRERAIHSRSSEIRRMLERTFPHFFPVFHGVCWLLDGSYPQDVPQTLGLIGQHWQLENLFARIQQPVHDQDGLRTLAGDYILGIESITQSIDRMEVQS